MTRIDIDGPHYRPRRPVFKLALLVAGFLLAILITRVWI